MLVYLSFYRKLILIYITLKTNVPNNAPETPLIHKSETNSHVFEVVMNKEYQRGLRMEINLSIVRAKRPKCQVERLVNATVMPSLQVLSYKKINHFVSS